MPKITWDETFSVHNPELDEQHKRWIALANELHDVLTGDDMSQLRTISEKTLAAMMEYVRYHFAAEEKFLRSVNYPDFAAHKQIHDIFYVQTKGLYNDVKSGEKVLNTEIMKALTNWLQSHILQEDMKYCRFVASSDRPDQGH